MSRQSKCYLKSVWIWLLTAQKPINRPGWWKGKFISNAGSWGRGRVADICPKADSPPPGNQRGKSSYRQSVGGGLYAEIAQSSLTVIFKLVTGGVTSVILVFLGAVNHQFQGLFFPHFSEANSENCGSSCPEYSLVIMYLTSPPGVLVSIRQLTGYGSEYYL